LTLDLDAVEVDVMNDSDEVEDIQNQERPQRNEDLFNYDGVAIEVGGSSPRSDATPEPEDEYDHLNFD
jgi:hypothetical protein